MQKTLEFRRPLRFGSGLVATNEAKITSLSVLIGFGGGLVIMMLFSLLFVRDPILGAPVAAGSLPMIYLLLINMMIPYPAVFCSLPRDIFPHRGSGRHTSRTSFHGT